MEGAGLQKEVVVQQRYKKVSIADGGQVVRVTQTNRLSVTFPVAEAN